MLAAVAKKLAEFHKKAETDAAISAFGDLNTIRQNTGENFAQTGKYIGRIISQEQYERIRSFTENFLERNASLFRRRVSEGRIRDCHGDLHAAHVCFCDGICIYDCIEFNDRFRYDGDYGIRGLLTDDFWTVVYLRPSVRYKDRDWLSLHGGAALFYNFFEGEEDLPELRPWLGVRFGWPRLGGFAFSHYLRLELRAFYLHEESQWDGSLRGRYQLAVQSPRFAIGPADAFYILASVEAFEDLAATDNTTFGDRFRFNFGIGKKVTNALRMELNYLFHKVRLSDERGDFDFDDHVVRLRFFYSFI